MRQSTGGVYSSTMRPSSSAPCITSFPGCNNVCILRRLAIVALALAFGLSAPAQTPETLSGIRTIQISALGNGPQARAMQERIAERLNKSGRLHAVTAAQASDAVLRGTSTLWASGRVSLNPRSHSVSSVNYQGYLSVELVDAGGQPLWSYLVTPSRFSMSGVADDLADQVASHLLSVVKSGAASAPAVGSTAHAVALHGAGATFPAPLYQRWFESSGQNVSYDANGSEAGLQMLTSGKADFAASDMPLSDQDSHSAHVRQFATVLGGVVPIYNLPGAGRDLNLTPEVLAGIYSGAIRKWNDPRIRAINHALKLPNAEIAVIHRSEGSGTTFVWSSFLSAASPEWKSSVGAGPHVAWPVGSGAKGNEGVAELVKKTEHSIGYVELTFAIQHQLNYAAVKNSAGQFIKADLASITAAAAGVPVTANQSLPLSILNAPGKNAYPISTFTWIMVPEQVSDSQERTALADLLNWMLTSGQKQCSALGYAPLPHEVAVRELQAISTLK
ncbi:phosphate ABC transporter substrate-binding protein PstS [Granulicella aggregans]|uniref:phosphate ABC transporter substrate-binding protein PstS n=1 Tax=Granulicella aggregans TaxID=474949 RepID=UPI0021DF50E0|nr:phosphate ABC transporter substrate-binding protein PstS [Granulicella aggregans]